MVIYGFPPQAGRYNLRRERDSNPRTLAGQRFSRPPQSTALPSLLGFFERAKILLFADMAKLFSQAILRCQINCFKSNFYIYAISPNPCCHCISSESLRSLFGPPSAVLQWKADEGPREGRRNSDGGASRFEVSYFRRLRISRVWFQNMATVLISMRSSGLWTPRSVGP